MMKAFFKKVALPVCIGFLSLTAPVFADGLGSKAWVLNNSALSTGPGTVYAATGQTVIGGQSLRVTRCSRRWCKVANSNGWLSLDNLSFGQQARGPFSGPKFSTGRGGDGKVCFYTGSNFSGSSICLGTGAVARDLVLWGWDNKISSVSVGDGVSVNLCRDRNFSSYCELIDKDTPRLSRLLSNAASSYQIW